MNIKTTDNYEDFSCLVFSFKNRDFFVSFNKKKVQTNSTLVYFPGLIEQKEIILKNSIKCIFNITNEIIYTKLKNTDVLKNIGIKLKRNRISKHKKLTHKTNKIRKIHTHKYYGTYFDIELVKV